MSKTKPEPATIGDRDPLTKVIDGSISKTKAASSLIPTTERTVNAMSMRKTVYIVTSTLSDPHSPNTHNVSDVFPTLEAANTAAKQLCYDYRRYSDRLNDRYQEEQTSDGRLTIQTQGEDKQTLDVRVEFRTLEAAATDAGETKVRQHKVLSEVERRKKNQRVYIVTHEEYERSMGEMGNVEIIGVYGSVAKANVAARARMKDNLGDSEDEDSEGESEVEVPDESFDSEGCVTLTAAEGLYEQWTCSVNSYNVG